MSYPSEAEASQSDIKVYGAHWCGDCRRAEYFFDLHQVPYTWIDVDGDPAALDYIRELQNGGRSIPTIVFKDGSILVEPTNAELAHKLGLVRGTGGP